MKGNKSTKQILSNANKEVKNVELDSLLEFYNITVEHDPLNRLVTLSIFYKVGKAIDVKDITNHEPLATVMEYNGFYTVQERRKFDDNRVYLLNESIILESIEARMEEIIKKVYQQIY